MKKKTGNKINRRYKDRLFYALFGSEERKRLTLELYNAINQTDYDNPDDLQLNTIEDVVYMGMKNDVSFLLASDLNMYEQQSTWNPNMPLRCFLYAAHALEKYLRDTRNSSRLLTEYDEEETLKVVAEDARAEGEAIGMAKGEAIGVAKGEAIGVAKGEDRLALLFSAMVQNGADQEAILKASTDPAYRKEMYTEYHIE